MSISWIFCKYTYRTVYVIVHTTYYIPFQQWSKTKAQLENIFIYSVHSLLFINESHLVKLSLVMPACTKRKWENEEVITKTTASCQARGVKHCGAAVASKDTEWQRQALCCKPLIARANHTQGNSFFFHPNFDAAKQTPKATVAALA